MQTVTALEFRKKFGEILDLVNHNETVLITRQNTPVGIIYPFKDKKLEIEEEKREERAKEIIEALREFRKKWGGKKKYLKKDSVEIIRETRDSRYGANWWKTKTNY